ncbi:MAG: hypothetical protein GX896_07910 [Clostridiales bacterium]|nr:hypothetical protein [Clostridiales bacterium]
MFLPQISAVRKSTSKTVQFLGINKGLTTAEGELSDACGLCTNNFPVLSSRTPRATRKTLRGNRYRISKNNLIHEFGTGHIRTSTFYGFIKDSFITISDFSDKDGNLNITALGCLNNDILVLPANRVVTINIIDLGEKDEDIPVIEIIESDSDAPVFARFLVTDDNRLWCCSSEKHEIYASKLGDAKKWNVYKGLASDSYAVTVGSDGDFTGSASYQGYVHFFKENLIHRIYGNKPANYQINTINQIGVKAGSEKTICEVNGCLYYLSTRGVARFDGSQATIISKSLGNRFYGKHAGTLGKKYYITMKIDDESEYKIYCYDTEKKIWHIEDIINCEYVFCDSHLLITYVDEENYDEESPNDLFISEIEYSAQTWIDQGATTEYMGVVEPVAWYAVFAPTIEGSFDKKYISKLQLHCETGEDTVFQVDIKYDNDCDFVTLATFRGLKRETKNIPIIPKRHERFQIRIKGKGEIKLYGYTKTISHGSEI